MRVSSSMWLIVCFAGVAILILAGRAYRPLTPEEKNVEDHERARRTIAWYVEKTKPEVQRSLPDLTGARFGKGSMAVANLENGQGLWVVCGYVNAKDGLGIYTGNQPWYMFIPWDGTSSICVNELTDCKYPVIGGPQAAQACQHSLDK